MPERYLWIAGSLIFLALGILHFYYTFFSDKFSPRDEHTEDGMKNTSPLLTRGTTMWKAWIGFNASHSLGAVFFGLFNLVIAVRYFSLLQHSVSLIALTGCTSLFYCWLAKKYWFKIPFTCITIATACFLFATVLICIS